MPVSAVEPSPISPEQLRNEDELGKKAAAFAIQEFGARDRELKAGVQPSSLGPGAGEQSWASLQQDASGPCPPALRSTAALSTTCHFIDWALFARCLCQAKREAHGRDKDPTPDHWA